MKIEDQIKALAQADGWMRFEDGTWATEAMATEFIFVRSPKFYPTDLTALHNAKLNLITNTELRVKWINTLRSIVARRAPKNHIGTPIVTDVDLHFATGDELLESLVKTLGLWIEGTATNIIEICQP